MHLTYKPKGDLQQMKFIHLTYKPKGEIQHLCNVELSVSLFLFPQAYLAVVACSEEPLKLIHLTYKPKYEL